MSKYQRTRGAVYEREVCGDLTKALDRVIKREIGQARDGGGDIVAEPLLVECKRRKGIAHYEWLEQAARAAEVKHLTPCVVARADTKPSTITMYLADFLRLFGAELRLLWDVGQVQPVMVVPAGGAS